jgi:tetrahydromethanopterin S-methyltransferase subunit F
MDGAERFFATLASRGIAGFIAGLAFALCIFCL